MEPILHGGHVKYYVLLHVGATTILHGGHVYIYMYNMYNRTWWSCIFIQYYIRNVQLHIHVHVYRAVLPHVRVIIPLLQQDSLRR